MFIFNTLEIQFPFSICVLHFFFSFLCSSSSAGEKHMRDVLFPPCTIHCIISYGKNWGRLGDGSGEEKIYALMSNSFSKKRDAYFASLFLCREYLIVLRLSSQVQS